MEILNIIYSIVTGNILSFILILSAVVFIHEMGHYLVGRWCGIYATVFSIGFGKEIWGFTGKDGTRWRIAMVPLGGYVKFFGDENAASAPEGKAIAEMSEEDKVRSFNHASVLRRFLTVLAGPLANFLLTIVILSSLYALYGRQVADPVITRVIEQSPADRAGLEKGDLFVSIDGIKVSIFSEVKRYIASRSETMVDITVLRDGQEKIVSLIPDRKVNKDRFGNEIEEGIMGVIVTAENGNFRHENFTISQAIGLAFAESWYIITRTFDYIGNIFAGRESAAQLSGPIGIAKVSGQVATLGIVALVKLTAIISLSIGLLNLMPIPILDGGHLVFYVLEAIRGRPVNGKAQEMAFRVGLILILSLMLFTTYNDVGAIYRHIFG